MEAKIYPCEACHELKPADELTPCTLCGSRFCDKHIMPMYDVVGKERGVICGACAKRAISGGAAA